MRAPPAALPLAMMLLTGCRAQPPPSSAPDAARAPAPTEATTPPKPTEKDPAPETEPDVEAQRARLVPLARQVDRALRKVERCAGCCVSWIDEAGRDRRGQDLLVATVGEECLVPGRPSPTPPEQGDCTQIDHYLLARKGDRVRPVALLAAVCRYDELTRVNVAHGVAVDKQRKTFTENRMWGGGQRGEGTVVVGLDPLRLVGSERDNMDEDADGRSHEWSSDDFAGKSAWGAIDCNAKARLAAPGAPDAGADAEPAYSIEGLAIPFLELPDDFAAGTWRTTRLGTCSAFVDSSGNGYTLHGSAGAPEDATLRVLLTGVGARPSTLFVEVTDDRFVGPGRSWVTDDHLELWMGDATLGSQRVCGKETREWSAQWGIRVADGAVFPAHGAPPPLTGVERVMAGRTVRFKIPLPERGQRLTVVYSDSDDGRRQERLIGTSQLRFGDPATFGDVSGEPTGPGAACLVKRGALQPKPALIEPSLTDPAAGSW
jgi:hypothetical protein